MLMKILIGIVVVIVLLVIVVALQPSAFKVTRTVTVAAPAATAFAQVNDFHKWATWSPWEKIDPNLKRDYEGAASGVGAAYHWVGNRQVGEGRMTVTESKPNDSIRIKLDFIAPFQATNQADFAFKQDGANTQVTWTMTGERSFMMKGMGLIMNFDKYIGGQFDQGLANLKTVAEAAK